MPSNAAMIRLFSMLHMYPRLFPHLSNAFHNTLTLPMKNSFNHQRLGWSKKTSSFSSSSQDETTNIEPLEVSIQSCTNDQEISRVLASYLIQQCKVKLTLAIAGGGSSSISALSSISGSSKVLMEGNLLYHRSSFAHYISSSLKNHALYLPEIILCQGDLSSSSKFHFASSQASFLLAYSALYQCLSIIASSSNHSLGSLKQLNNECIGVGCSSALIHRKQNHDDGNRRSSGHIQTGEGEVKSHAHISTWGADGRLFHYDITLSNQQDGETFRRNRVDEEQVIGNLILWAILHHNKLEVEDVVHRNRESYIERNYVLRRILNKPGDNISMRYFHQHEEDSSQKDVIHTVKYRMTQSQNEWKKKVEYTAHRIHTKKIDVALLVPSWLQQGLLSHTPDEGLKSHRHESICSEKQFSHFSILGHTVLPQHIIIFPGSFNPIHAGHVALAHAAMDTIQTKIQQIDSRDRYNASASIKDSKSLMERVWNATIPRSSIQPSFSILLEISLINPDKPPIESTEVVKRLESFITYLKEESESICDDVNSMSNSTTKLSTLDWGVLLSSSPLFSEKVQLLKQYLPQETIKSHMHLIFVIGADTMIRIINPKYYNNSFENMLEAVRDMAKVGVHFVVGGRLEQNPKMNVDRRYITCEDELMTLPKDIQELFTLLPQFRVDISSSELRARKT